MTISCILIYSDVEPQKRWYGFEKIFYLFHEGNILLGNLLSLNLQCCNVRNDSEGDGHVLMETSDHKQHQSH